MKADNSKKGLFCRPRGEGASCPVQKGEAWLLLTHDRYERKENSNTTGKLAPFYRGVLTAGFSLNFRIPEKQVRKQRNIEFASDNRT